MHDLQVIGCQGVDVDSLGYGVRLMLAGAPDALVADLIESWPYEVAGMVGMTVATDDDRVVILEMKDPTMAVAATKWFIQTAGPEITARASEMDEARADAEKRVREHFEFLAS